MLTCCLIVLSLLLINAESASACDEPKFCQENKKYCITREHFREKCPCTCAADISLAQCCAQQNFEQKTCQKLCTFGLTESMVSYFQAIIYHHSTRANIEKKSRDPSVAD